MPSTATSRIEGLSTSVSVKAPVKAIATANITLSGEQTISGTAVTEDGGPLGQPDRVLVTAQTDASDNGIYCVSTGAWTRSLDFDGNRDVVQGTLVVAAHESPARFYRVTSANPIVIGTSDINFSLVPGLGANYWPLTEAEEDSDYALTEDDVDTSKPYWDFERHGGDPAGVNDSITAMQKTIDISGYCTYRGLIKVTTPIMAKTGMHMKGEGFPLIFNPSASPASQGICIMFGSYDDGGFTDSGVTYYACNNVTVDNDSVTCTTAAQAANFTVGDVVYLWSHTLGYAASGYFKPAYQQINVVEAVSAITGEVHLRHQIYMTHTNMRISKGGARTAHELHAFTPFMTRDWIVEDTRFGSTNDAWTRLGGYINGTLRNILVEYGNNVCATNGMAYSVMENVRGCVDVRSFELAQFCHYNVIRDCASWQCPDTTTAQDLGMITYSEGAHHNRIYSGRAAYHSSTSALVAKFGQGSFHNEIHDFNVKAGTLAFGATASNAQQAAGMQYGHNLIQGGVWDIAEITGDLFDFGAANAAHEVGIEVRNLKVICPTIGTRLFDFDGKNITIEDMDLRGCVADTILVSAGSTQVTFSRNRLPSGQAAVANALTTLAQAGVLSRDNSIVGREELEMLNLTYGSATAITSTLSTNSLASRAIAAAVFVADDELIVDVGGVLTGTDAHTIDVLWDGDVIMSFTTTTADEFGISGRIKLLSATAWKAVTWQSIGNAGDTIRKATTSDTAAISGNGLLEIRAYVGNAASSITVDFASVRYVSRY